MWALDHWDTIPDILVTSKGSAGGYFPLGFMAAKGADVEQVRHALGDFNHGGTFSHHAVGAAAGLATLRIMQREKLVENSAAMGKHIGAKLREALAEHPHVGDIRGRGLFWGLELVQDRPTKQPYPKKQNVVLKLRDRAFDMGLIVYHSVGCSDGINGDVVMLGPPLIVDEAQVERDGGAVGGGDPARTGQLATFVVKR